MRRPASLHRLTVPSNFIWSVQQAVTAAPPSPRDLLLTKWFAGRMQAVAEASGLHCYNKGAKRPYEVLNVDHVFARSDGYDTFPIVAVEHENGNLGSRGGELPRANSGEHIEWAVWKALALRVELSVAVVYPYVRKRDAFESVVSKMVAGWSRQHGRAAPLLILAGWWNRKPSGLAQMPELYEALTPRRDGTLEPAGRVLLPD